MIRFALHLRYTSLQSYKLLLETFPLPSISTLHRIQAGGVDSLKAAKKLREKGHISSDVILMVDEMFLQKEASYQSGDYVGEDEEGELYKGIACFMIVGLKQSVPHYSAEQAITEVTGEWLAEKISASLHSLAQTGFTVRGIVTDNHNSNVNAFKSLKQKFGKGNQLFIQHPSNPYKNIYLFFDTPHLIKNVRNNLLNSKRFVFPQFDYEKDGIEIYCPAGYLAWSSYALVLTLRAQSELIKELLSEGYDFVMTSRLQSDPIERRFSQYRQMSGGRFLVSFREVTNLERIIRCRSLVKADINFWKEDLGSEKPSLDFLLFLLC